MKRKFLLITVAILIFSLFSSCNTSGKTIYQPSTTDRFTDSPPNTTESVFTKRGEYARYGISGKNVPQDKIYNYYGEPIVLSYIVTCEKIGMEVGFLLFLDGVPQHYKLESSTSIHTLSTYMQSTDVKSDEPLEISLSFLPSIGNKGDICGLYLMPLFEPSYLPSEDYPVFLGKHISLTTFPCSVRFYENGAGEKIRSTSLSEKKIDDNTLEALSVPNKESLDNNCITALSSASSSIIDVNGKQTPFSVIVAGGETKEYRTYIFANHAPLSINGYDCFSSILPKGYTHFGDFSLDLSGLPKYSSIYAVTVPCGDSYHNRYSLLFKSGSNLVVNNYLDDETKGRTETELSSPTTDSSGTKVQETEPISQITIPPNSPDPETEFVSVETEPPHETSETIPVFSNALEELNQALNTGRYGNKNLFSTAVYDSAADTLFLSGEGLLAVDLSSDRIVVSSKNDYVKEKRFFVTEKGYALLYRQTPFLPLDENNHAIIEYLDKNLNTLDRYDLSVMLEKEHFPISEFPSDLLSFCLLSDGHVVIGGRNCIFSVALESGNVKRYALTLPDWAEDIRSTTICSLSASLAGNRLLSVMQPLYYSTNRTKNAIAVIDLEGNVLRFYPDDDFAIDHMYGFSDGAIFGSAYDASPVISGYGSDPNMQFSGKVSILYADGTRVIQNMSENNESFAPIISYNGKYLAAKSKTDGCVRLYDAKEKKLIASYYPGTSVGLIGVRNDGTILIKSGLEYAFFALDNIN